MSFIYKMTLMSILFSANLANVIRFSKFYLLFFVAKTKNL